MNNNDCAIHKQDLSRSARNKELEIQPTEEEFCNIPLLNSFQEANDKKHKRLHKTALGEMTIIPENFHSPLAILNDNPAQADKNIKNTYIEVSHKSGGSFKNSMSTCTSDEGELRHSVLTEFSQICSSLTEKISTSDEFVHAVYCFNKNVKACKTESELLYLLCSIGKKISEKRKRNINVHSTSCTRRKLKLGGYHALQSESPCNKVNIDHTYTYKSG